MSQNPLRKSKQIIECVPNFSEGRRYEVIQEIESRFRDRKGVYMLDSRADSDHNRLVISLAGEPEPLADALIDAAKTSLRHIDMEKHTGGHPRIGAVDVISFTPLRNITMAECAALTHEFGARYYRETEIPVYFYEESATRPDRKNLEVVRKGQYELLCEEVKHNPDRRPDVGDPCLHPSAGATAIGARKLLVAFNVNLATEDVGIAKKIAATLRSSSGGFRHVKAIGLALESRGAVQVSMNVTDYEKNSLYRVLEMVRMEARRYGVAVLGTEVYGMVSAEALLDSAAYYMQTEGFSPGQIIEMRLLEMMGEEND